MTLIHIQNHRGHETTFCLKSSTDVEYVTTGAYRRLREAITPRAHAAFCNVCRDVYEDWRCTPPKRPR